METDHEKKGVFCEENFNKILTQSGFPFSLVELDLLLSAKLKKGLFEKIDLTHEKVIIIKTFV